MHEDEIPVGRAEDLTNKVFGGYTVLYRTFNDARGNTCWKCRCNRCGAEKVIRKDALKNSKIGCIQCTGKNNIKDLTGKQIGDLLVLEMTDQRSNGAVIWKCQDINTDEIIYRRTDLVYNYVSKKYKVNFSSMSKGEIVIFFTLKYNNIQFEFQKTFDNCRYPNTNYCPKFDFYINNQYIIEYDGEQHYQEIELFDQTINFEQRQINDEFKNQWCKNNNIPLIRIPYTHLNDLCIEDLLLETSKFII